jgi:mono/diheme cytochrome c family protein
MTLHKNLLIALTCVIGAARCAVSPRQSQAAPPEHSTEVRAGGKLFAHHCASCHGADATGTSRAPNLHTPSVQARPDAALAEFLTDGDLRKGMPSWSRLPEERRWQLVRYLKSLPAQAE